ncbi:MAG: hypothetical protein LH466_08590 [Sphingomonas bacterium]|nr:hypothetical protein [Sphingomonas bacterium]
MDRGPRIAVLGAGGHAKVVIETLRASRFLNVVGSFKMPPTTRPESCGSIEL